MGSLTLVDLFTIISSIATAVCAYIALKTLWEMKIQRESSYKPDIEIHESTYSFMIDEKRICISNNKYKLESPNKDIFDLQLRLLNLGLGAAKRIQIRYEYPLRTVVNEINSLKLPTDKFNFSVKLDGNILRVNNRCYVYKNSNQQYIDFLLPNTEPKDKEYTSLYIPHYILYLHIVYMQFQYYKDIETRQSVNISSMDFQEFPPLTAYITFYDISSKCYNKVFNIYFDIAAFSATNGDGRIKITQI